MILSTKLKNQFKGQGLNLKFTLRNITINGTKTGCSGFIRDLDTNSVVYVNTEESCLSNLRFMYRYSDDEKDFTGYRNHWASTLEELITGICTLLKTPVSESSESKLRI